MRRLVHKQQRVCTGVIKNRSVKTVLRRFFQRHNFYLLQIFHAALIFQAETADRVNRIVKPFYAQRQFAVDGENIQNIAAHAKLADSVNLLRAFITKLGKACNQRLLVNNLAAVNLHAVGNGFFIRQLLQKRFCRYKNNAAFLAAQKAQRTNTFRLHLAAFGIRLHARQIRRV